MDSPSNDKWGDIFESSVVHVERVIAYWSRTFKSAECHYSTTEREALAAKEGLVKFQPFIEGKRISLIMDHSALQWARTYKNSNRRLAAWGAVFSAYAPDLEIIHRAGRIHSNMDPLSRLPQSPPDHISPACDNELTIKTDSDLAERQERQAELAPARMAFVIWSLDDCLEGRQSAWAMLNETQGDSDTLDELETSMGYWNMQNPTSNLHIAIDEGFLKDWIKGYESDCSFGPIWKDIKSDNSDGKANG